MVDYVVQRLFQDLYLAAPCSPAPLEAPRHPAAAPDDGDAPRMPGAAEGSAQGGEARAGRRGGCTRRMRGSRAARARRATANEGADR